MADAFECDLSQSIPILLAMQDDGFAKRFAILLTSGEYIHAINGSERWECMPETVAQLIVAMRGRGEHPAAFLGSLDPSDAYVEGEVVVRALQHLGWRIETASQHKRLEGRLTLSYRGELRAHG